MISQQTKANRIFAMPKKILLAVTAATFTVGTLTGRTAGAESAEASVLLSMYLGTKHIVAD